MADGEGLLAAQQSAAAQIPYRNSQMALQGAETAASSVVNAFFMAQQINSKRQQLEQQLMNQQFKMTLDNQKFDNTIHEQAWKHQYELGQEQRRTDTANANTYIATQRLGLTEAIDKQKFDMNTVGTEATTALVNDVSELKKKSPPGTMDYGRELPNIIASHRDAFNTKDGKALVKMYQDEHVQGAKGLHQNAIDEQRQYDRLAKTFGTESIKPQDFWSGYEFDTKTVPGKSILWTDTKGHPVNPKDLPDNPRSQGFVAHTTTNEHLGILRDNASRMEKFTPKFPGSAPDPQEPQYETIPQNPADRRPNTTYNSKKGLVIWDGTNARLVNP